MVKQGENEPSSEHARLESQWHHEWSGSLYQHDAASELKFPVATDAVDNQPGFAIMICCTANTRRVYRLSLNVCSVARVRMCTTASVRDVECFTLTAERLTDRQSGSR